MNNHYRGAELANAIELKFLVTGQKQQVPEGLLKTYPDLARVALPVTGDKDGEARSKTQDERDLRFRG